MTFTWCPAHSREMGRWIGMDFSAYILFPKFKYYEMCNLDIQNPCNPEPQKQSQLVGVLFPCNYNIYKDIYIYMQVLCN